MGLLDNIQANKSEISFPSATTVPISSYRCSVALIFFFNLHEPVFLLLLMKPELHVGVAFVGFLFGNNLFVGS